jgi:hypothetical protein
MIDSGSEARERERDIYRECSGEQCKESERELEKEIDYFLYV